MPRLSKLIVPLLLPARIEICKGEVKAESEGGPPVSRPIVGDTGDTVVVKCSSSSSISSSKAIDSILGRQSKGDASRKANHSASIYPVGSAMQFARNKQ